MSNLMNCKPFMKRLSLLVLAAFAFTACLDTLPEDFTSPSTWYKNQKELEASLASVYDPLRDCYSVYLSVEFSQGSDRVFFERVHTQARPLLLQLRRRQQQH